MHLDFKTALELSVVSMAIVFVTLYGISLVLGAFEKIFEEKEASVTEKKTKVETKSAPVATANTISYEEIEKDEDMLVAVIVASMEAAKENKNTNYKVTNVRQVM